MRALYHVLGIGNAIVDILAPVSDQFLDQEQIVKSSMGLIDQNRALALHKSMRSHVKKSGTKLIQSSGGSGANSIAGIAALGVKTAFIGKSASDKTGQVFRQELKSLGIHAPTQAASSSHASARCLIAITPDGERSMSTFLGVNTQFTAKDIDKKTVQASELCFLEGYLFDSDNQKAGYVKACEIAKASGRKVALTLSDVFCVDRHRASFQHLVKNHVDIVFANKAELLSLYQVDDLGDALQQLWATGTTGCITRSEKGSVIIENGHIHEIPAHPVSKVLDTTGAGDQYAAGVLAGRAMGMHWADAGRLGSVCAGEVISHIGGRPQTDIGQRILENKLKF